MSKRELVPQPAGMPVRLDLNDVPDLLYGAILQVEDTAVPHIAPFPARVQELARDHLRKLAPFMVPASPQLITKWCKPMVAAAPNQRTPQQMADWVGAVMLALSDVPAGAFTVDNQRAMLRTLTFFPSPADLWKIIEDDVRRLRRREGTLKAIIGGPNG